METLDRSRQNQDGGKSPFLSSLALCTCDAATCSQSSSPAQHSNSTTCHVLSREPQQHFHPSIITPHTSYYTPHRDEYRGRMLFERMNSGPGALDGYGTTLT